MSSKPPTTPSSSSASKNLRKQPQPQPQQPLTETPIRTIQDHGTVGAVANNGSDLSYDLSSADSSFHVHNNKQQDDDVDDGVEVEGGGGGDNHKNDKNIVDQGAGGNMNVNIIVSPLPLPREVVVKDKENENDDDNLSLDDEKVSLFKGEYGVRNRKLDFDSNKHYRDGDGDFDDHDDIAKNGIVIQDLHQLRLDKSNSSVHDHDDDHNDYDKEDEGGKGGGTKNGTGLDLESVAQWIHSGKCSKILVLCGAGVSCSAGIPDFRTPGSGL